MGIDDMQFDILGLLREEVAHLPRSQRRKAFLELVRGVAEDFLHTAKRFDLSTESSNSSSSESIADISAPTPQNIVQASRPRKRGR